MARLSRVLAVGGCLVAFSGGVAGASSTQQSLFQDNVLLLNDPGHLDSTLSTLRSLGVERLRVSVSWSHIAPQGNSRQAPRFNASDPGAYPAYAWAPYDKLVTEAGKYGLKVDFDVMGEAPRWATPTAPADNLQSVWYPSAAKFGAFVAPGRL